MKLGCIVQGNIRVPLGPIIDKLSKQFDVVVVSTWTDDAERCPPGNYELLLNNKPAVAGVTNRNLQRYSTARGLDILGEAGCTHILKWRTDILPTRLDVMEMLKLCHKNSSNELGGRIVTGSFRHLSVDPDWFSSFPDLYAFSTLDGMRLLWSDHGFSYDREFNIPRRMRSELGIVDGGKPDSMVYRGVEYSLRGIYAYDAHTELYAIFKDRLERQYGTTLTHADIISKYFCLIDDDRLGVFWFGSSGSVSFRPIRQGYHIRWWKEGDRHAPKIYGFDELQCPAETGFFSRLRWSAPVRYQVVKQIFRYVTYRLGAFYAERPE